jgi:hypothetical protein
MGWDGPGGGRNEEDRWARSERWSDRAESYRELADPDESARFRRENSRLDANCLSVLGLPAAGWVAHTVQRALGEHGPAWWLLWFGAQIGVVALLALAWRRWS